MSIGARASIYEQTRHISKYGLDGDMDMRHRHQHHDDSSPTKSHASTPDEWDRIMDGSIIESQASFSFGEGHSGHNYGGMNNHSSFSLLRNNASHSQPHSHPHALDGLDENHPLDMTYQSDYFDSSRLANLATPEKNKPKVDEASRLARLGMGASMQRGDPGNERTGGSGGGGNMFQSLLEESISGSTSGDMDQSGMIGMFNAALRMGQENNDLIQEDEDEREATQSFISYHEPNMSIINMHTSNHKSQSLSEENAADYFHGGDGDGDNNCGIPSNKGEGCIHLDDDIQASFISYREPDLSMIDRGAPSEIGGGNRSPSEFGEGNRTPSEFRGGNRSPSDFGGHSEISYREPDLSIIDRGGNHNRAPSEFGGNSEFDVDVSEIIAPSDFESRVPYAYPLAKALSLLPSSLEEQSILGRGSEVDFSPCSSPFRSSNDNDAGLTPPSLMMSAHAHRNYIPADEVGWPSASPARVHSPMVAHARNHMENISHDHVSSPMAHHSGVKTHSYNHVDNNNGNLVEDGKYNEERLQTPPSPKDQSQDPLKLKANLSFISPIDNQSSSDKSRKNDADAFAKPPRAHSQVNSNSIRNSRGYDSVSPLSQVEPPRIHIHSQVNSNSIRSRGYDSFSPLSQPKSASWRTTNTTGSADGSKTTYENTSGDGQSKYSSNAVPQRISLRERYSRPDRFDDSYTVPSSASTLNSSPQTYNDESAVARSLLQTFESDCYSPSDYKARMFAI